MFVFLMKVKIEIKIFHKACILGSRASRPLSRYWQTIGPVRDLHEFVW